MLSEYKQDSLRDLIKKYLQSSSHRNSFMSKAINEIKTELFKSDKDVKIHALLKLLTSTTTTSNGLRLIALKSCRPVESKGNSMRIYYQRFNSRTIAISFN